MKEAVPSADESVGKHGDEGAHVGADAILELLEEPVCVDDEAGEDADVVVGVDAFLAVDDGPRSLEK